MAVRKEVIGDATLWLGDCREVMPDLSGVDAVVTDPPYGINYARGSSKTGLHRGPTANKHAKVKIAGDDKPFDPSLVLSLAPQIIMWGADHFYPRLPDSGRWLAWNKLGLLEPWDSFSDVEFAWHNGEGAARIFSLMWKGLVCNKTTESGFRDHPTQKPIALMEWCIQQLTGRPNHILDPFMGSGTTGVACARMGRKFTGCELDARYFDAACRRIEAAQKQSDLFVHVPVAEDPAEQRLRDLFAEPAE
jgi:site-specific DNA-methyltransferase (adenine-specific)